VFGVLAWKDIKYLGKSMPIAIPVKRNASRKQSICKNKDTSQNFRNVVLYLPVQAGEHLLTKVVLKCLFKLK